MLSPLRVSCAALSLSLLFASQAHAQQNGIDSILRDESFIKPAPEIAAAVLAPRYENATLGNPSPDGRYLLDERSAPQPTQALFARPFYRLGGQQIDWRANRARQLTTRSDIGIDIVDAQTGAKVSVRVPAGARVSSPKWSPDGSSLGLLVHVDDGSYVYTANPANGQSRQVTRTPVLATLYTSFEWTPDSRSIVTVLPPENRGAPPAEPAVPTGPKVRLTTPETNRLRTYPDLLLDPYEQAALEYYNTGQLAVVDVQSRRIRRIGATAMISDVEVAPDGMNAIVTAMSKPFSYIVPVSQFGSVEQVWSLEDGSVLALVREQKVDEGTPNDTTDNNGDPERRNAAWRPDGQGLMFLQQAPRQPGDSARQDTGGQAEAGARGRAGGRRDRVMQWLPPYDSTSMTVTYENSGRISNARFSEDAKILFLTEQQGENATESAIFLDDPSTKHRIWRGERQGFGPFGGGGGPRILTKDLANGTSVVRVAGEDEQVYLAGVDYHGDGMEDGPQSYIDRVEIKTGDKTRVFESENDGVWERVLEVLDDGATQLLVTREGPTDVADSYIRNTATNALRQLTQNTNYTPELTNAQRRRLEVARADGFKLAVNVTLPGDWSPGERLPGMIWFYPREFTDQDDYDETRNRWNKNQFPNIGTRSMDILALAGYVVIQPDAPIVGESGRMNDNYVNDLRNNLAAVIDALDAEGLIDRQRLAIGGHSYGAFSTFNAMVHTPFFKAGIAGDGNNNRTLTPFSFQNERRTLWQAQDVYLEMSPFFNADHITGALLMYHGEDDQNVGTFPIHSWRLFDALEALGKTASLYFYPYEEHGPATQETLLDMWARWVAWLDKYVKNAGQETEVKVTTEQSTGGR